MIPASLASRFEGIRAALLDDLIRQEPFAFRRENLPTLQLVRVIPQLMDAENKHHSTIAVLLDVSNDSRVSHES